MRRCIKGIKKECKFSAEECDNCEDFKPNTEIGNDDDDDVM